MGVRIETVHHAARGVWTRPLSPYRAIVEGFDTAAWVVEGEKPFEPAEQVVSQVYVFLGDGKEVVSQVAALGWVDG